MPRPVHFDISADDPERAARFYETAFGWKVQKWVGSADEVAYWLIETGEGEPGIDGGMAPRGQGPEGGTVNTIGVPSLDEYLQIVPRAGGHITTEKMAIPGVGWLAYATDTEGHPLGVMEPDEKAGTQALSPPTAPAPRPPPARPTRTRPPRSPSRPPPARGTRAGPPRRPSRRPPSRPRRRRAAPRACAARSRSRSTRPGP